MAAPGTLKRGAPSAPSVRTVINFIRPAGQKLTLRTQKEPETSGEVGSSEIHGAGSTGPVAIAWGHAKGTYKASVLSTEWDAICDKARAAGIPVAGQGGILGDIVQTTTVDGLPKRTLKVEAFGISKFSKKISGDGNMVDFEGPCMNIYENGSPMWTTGE